MGWLKKGWDQSYGAAWNRLTNRGDPNRGDPRVPNYQGPGAGYGEPRDGGFTWLPDAGQRILADHPLDAQGLPTGYEGQLPSSIAPQVQAVHERRLFEQRQAMQQDAVRSARGAASLLASFRPGGGAAIEAGVYSQIANLQMQSAQMTQPLDLLGDYRREQGAQAARQANRAAERALAIKAVGAIATIATAGAGAPLAAAAIGAGTALASQQGKPSSLGAPADGGYDQGQQQPYGPPEAAGGGGQPFIGPMPTGGGGGGGAPQGPMGGGSALGAPAGGGYQATLGQEGGGQQQGGQEGAGGPGQPGGQEGAGDMGGGGGVPGSDGIFDPTAYAADSMRQPVMSHPIVRLISADTAVNMMEESGLIPALSYAADRELARRLTA